MYEEVIKHKLTKYIGIFGLYVSGPLFFATTDPDKLPLPFLIFPFIWLFISIGFTMYLLLKLRTGAGKRQAGAVALLLASVPVLLLVFQSIHQLTIRDVLISVGLAGIAAFYLLRADFIR